MEVLKAMLEKDPQNRPSPAELLSTKIFGGLDTKESVAETAGTDSPLKMNTVNKSLEPKCLTALKALGTLSPKY